MVQETAYIEWTEQKRPKTPPRNGISKVKPESLNKRVFSTV